MPCTIEQECAIADQALQDSCRTGKIGKWKQTQTGCDYFPKTKQQSSSSKNRMHGLSPLAQTGPKQLSWRGEKRDGENSAKEDSV
jgi:hypothetical protein